MKAFVPLATPLDELGDFQIRSLIKTFGEGTMAIFNAVLSEKRVLFVGYGQNTETLCAAVLATVKMMCPPLFSLATTRAFPYNNIADLDFLSVAGYIAGVANPMFEMHTEWWDVLCNVENGKISFNPNTMAHVEKMPHVKCDSEFFASVNQKMKEHCSEAHLQGMFMDYLQGILDVALGEHLVLGNQGNNTKHALANKRRIEAWKTTKSYSTYVAGLEEQKAHRVIENANVPMFIKKLTRSQDLSETEMSYIYQTFIQNISTEHQLKEFLSLMPSEKGGLYPIAVGLFHPSDQIRSATVELFKRLDNIKSGSGFMTELNFFLYLAFNRLSNE